MDFATEFMQSVEFQTFVVACKQLFNDTAFTSGPMAGWSRDYQAFQTRFAQYERQCERQCERQYEKECEKEPRAVKKLSEQTAVKHTPVHTDPTDHLFRTSKPFTQACHRCEKNITTLERRIDAVTEELEVRLQAEDNAHREQMQARVNVAMAQAINSVVKKDTSSLNSVTVKSLSQTVELASDWTDVLNELKNNRRSCEAQHRRLQDDLNVLEQEAQFLNRATPETFLEYLQRRGDEDDEVEKEDYGGNASAAFTISDEAKTSVLKAAAAVDREHQRKHHSQRTREKYRRSQSQSRSASKTSPSSSSSSSCSSPASDTSFESPKSTPKRSELVHSD